MSRSANFGSAASNALTTGALLDAGAGGAALADKGVPDGDAVEIDGRGGSAEAGGDIEAGGDMEADDDGEAGGKVEGDDGVEEGDEVEGGEVEEGEVEVVGEIGIGTTMGGLLAETVGGAAVDGPDRGAAGVDDIDDGTDDGTDDLGAGVGS